MIGPGTKLDRYELREPIGSGGMSAVYRAYDPVLEREIAVKILPPELARDGTLRHRFHEEARALGRVDHPNLVKVYAVGQEGPVSFYAMELVKGLPLSRVIAAKGPFTPHETLAVFCQFLDGLGAIHHAGIIHRDIKPSNIMLDTAGRVVLMDFGLARRAERQTFTAAGSVLGTPEYMAPEQARGQRADPRSDLYSAGIVLYEMLAGQPPFKGPDSISVMRQHVEAPVPPLGEIAERVPLELQRVVGKLLAKRPDARYPHVEAVAAELRALQPAGHKPAQVAKDLHDAVAAIKMKPTRAMRQVRPPVAKVRRRSKATGRAVAAGKTRHWGVWVASAVAVMALLVAVLALLRPWGPRRPAPGWGRGVPWTVSLRDGTSFVGKIVGDESGPGGEVVYVFRLRNGEQRKIPVSQMRLWQNTKGGDTP